MTRFPQIGSKFPTFRGTSSTNNWSIVCISPSSHNVTYSYLLNHIDQFNKNDIEVIHFSARTPDTTLYIIDSNHILRAALHNNEDSPLTVTNLISIIDTLRSQYRPEIQGVGNQPINPACPNINKIVGEYVLGDPSNVDPYLLDFVIYAFALIQPNLTLDVYSRRYLQELADLRLINPDLKVILGIGGWGNDGFSDAALTPQSRYNFAREIKKWVNEYDLDGVDIDWEYPGSSAAGIKSRKQDKENFTLLLQAIRDVLGPDAWLSVAGVGDSSYIKNVEIEAIGEIINYFNLMAYDFTAGVTGSQGSKHQSNLFPSPLALNNISIDLYVQNLIDAGMPPEKILLGLALYGRNGATITKTFDEIRKSYLNKNGYTVKWDNVAKAPYIVDQYGNFTLSFDNNISIYFKGQYVVDNCLGGLFTWQSNMDKANILANAMSLSINDPQELENILQKEYLGK
ncbi:MAG: glycosyl hydrolase family 18 protein [Cellulosilyticaceae bacterium]|uniref:glycoside hydrolase family 18 protein n=1 Tax=Niameybacter sp. TaxID=2033640 RepID=UPI002FC74025